MPRIATLTVTVQLDPVQGTFDNAEDFVRVIQRNLDDMIPHYHPTVTINEVTEVPVTHTPEVWTSLLGVFILDADGWRDGTWRTPITRHEFIKRFQFCTIRLDATAENLLAELRS